MAIYGGTYMDDLLVGGPDADVLWGGMGDDELSGGAGNDRLIGGPGADTLNGGPGMDIASYADSPAGVHVDMSTPFADADEREPIRGGDAEGDSLGSIEIIWGSDFADVIKGTHSHNQLFGNGGSDMLYGMRGNDLLRGGYDDDQLFGGDGADTLWGDMGVDDLQGGAGNDTLFGGEDDDTLDGGPGHDLLEGGAGADDLTGGPGVDTAAYTMSSEAVTVDLRYPVSGNPAIQAPMGGDAMGDSVGMDIENLRGSMHDDMLIGDDMMVGDDPHTDEVETDHVLNTGRNMLFGNMGDDMLKGMGAADTLHGGKGDDTLYGGAGDDTLRGEMGDDALKGGEGSDVLVGGPGADKLFGGTVVDEKPVANEAGMNTADYSMSDAGVMIDLSATSRITGLSEPSAAGGHAEGDTLHDIQNVTGSAHTDHLVGDDEDNVLMGMDGDDWDDPTTARVTEGGLEGNGGNDLLVGGGGMDKLDGGAGMDDLWGGAGDDLILGGEGDERPFYTATQVDDQDSPITGQAMGDLVADTTLESLSLSDPSAAAAAAALMGMDIQRAGLFGGAGDDTLMGGTGADYIDGGAGNDTASYANPRATEGVVINLSGMDDPDGDNTPEATGGGDAANADDSFADILVNIENVIGTSQNDNIFGTRGANTLEGGDGDDQLWGGGGNDVLDAGKGADALTGGEGADTFVFGLEDAGTTANSVTDFSKRDGDQIDLTAFQLSHAELEALIDNANVTGSVFTLALGTTDATAGLNAGGGTIAVTMSDRFTELDVDDFII